MAPLTDPIRLEAYKDALANWQFQGYVRFEITETARNWVKRELSNVTYLELRRLMHEHVEAGGVIDEVREAREQWSEHEYHYDLRLTIQGQPVYIETRLNYDEPFVPDESTILVVNIHDP